MAEADSPIGILRTLEVGSPMQLFHCLQKRVQDLFIWSSFSRYLSIAHELLCGEGITHPAAGRSAGHPCCEAVPPLISNKDEPVSILDRPKFSQNRKRYTPFPTKRTEFAFPGRAAILMEQADSQARRRRFGFSRPCQTPWVPSLCQCINSQLNPLIVCSLASISLLLKVGLPQSYNVGNAPMQVPGIGMERESCSRPTWVGSTEAFLTMYPLLPLGCSKPLCLPENDLITGRLHSAKASEWHFYVQSEPCKPEA